MNDQPKPIVLVAGGAGRLGQLTIAELQRRGALVRALVRDATKPTARALADTGAELVVLDVASATPSDMASAVRGVATVVSTLQGGPEVIVEGQLRLLAAARDAAVGRFFPSDFSFNFFSLPEGVNVNSDWRRAFAREAELARGHVEVVHLMQGMFADADVLGFVGAYDRSTNAVRYWGDGKTPIDWTTWEDTAKFLAAAALDPAPLPSELFVAGDRMSILDFAERLAAVRSRPTLENVGGLADLRKLIEERRASDAANVAAWLPLQYALGLFSGDATLGSLSNARFADVHAESVEDAITRGAL